MIGASVIVLFAWSPWVRPTEVEWLGTYETWSDGIEASLGAGRTVSRAVCESTYDDEVGEPPTERLDAMSTAARRGCATLSAAGWHGAQADVVRALMLAHGDLLPPRQRPDISEIAASTVGVSPTVYCWQPEAWASFSEHYAIVRGGEEASLRGIPDATRNRIDLDPGICTALSRYLQRERPSPVTYQNFELAEALALLTHDAEHLKSPAAPEVDGECYAVQHVRPLVRKVWGPRFAEEIALHAWELEYLALPSRFRTPDCRNGRRLDLNPGSRAWP